MFRRAPTQSDFEAILHDCFARLHGELARDNAALNDADSTAQAEMRSRLASLRHDEISALARLLYDGGEITSQGDADELASAAAIGLAAGRSEVTPWVEAILSMRFLRTAALSEVEAVLHDRCARGTLAEQALGERLAAADGFRPLAQHLLATKAPIRSWSHVREMAEVLVGAMASESEDSAIPIDAAALEAVVRKRIARGTPAEQRAAAFFDGANGIAQLVQEWWHVRPVWSRRGAQEFADRIVAPLADVEPTGDAANRIELLLTALRIERRDAAWEALRGGGSV